MEIKIILILLLIYYIGAFIFKPKNNILVCGIFAWAGKDVKKFNKAKFDIQGLYNDSRGGDSCGVTSDGEIYYGITNTKHYSDFIVDSNYEVPVKIPTVFGHTRKSSSGSINSNNAHPFGFGDHEDGFQFVGVHNGTLHNHKELGKKYNVSEDIYKTEGEAKRFERTKIDSEVLLECLHVNQNFNVLCDYVGGAALIFTDTREPNVIYAFRGASKQEKRDSSDKIFEERPLYYYMENKNSLYISSMPESLIAIGGDVEENVFEFESNYVYKIKNGDISTAQKFKINRSEAHQKPFYGRMEDYYSHSPINISKKLKEHRKRKSNKNKLQVTEITNIFDEKVDKFYKSPIYMQKLRYWRNGHLITGIYTWVEQYGIVLLTSIFDNVLKEANSLLDIPFDLETGMFLRNEANMDIDYTNPNIVFPFNMHKNKSAPLLYFWEGILLQSDVDYSALINGNKKFSLLDLSEMSKHPIIDTSFTWRSESNQCIIKDRKNFTGKISPLCSGKIYDIDNGNLESVEINEEKLVDNILEKRRSSQCLLPLNTMNSLAEQEDETFMQQVIKDHMLGEDNLIELAQAFCDVEAKPIEDFVNEDPEIEVDGDREALTLIDSIMTPIYIDIQNAELVFRSFHKNQCIKNILECNSEYLISLDELIEKDYKN